MNIGANFGMYGGSMMGVMPGMMGYGGYPAAAYQAQFAHSQAGQMQSLKQWEALNAQNFAHASLTGKMDPLSAPYQPYGLGYGFGGLPYGGGMHALGRANVTDSTPPAFAYPLINGMHRPSYPVMGNPHIYGTDGFGFGQKHFGMDYRFTNPMGTNRDAMYGLPGYPGFMPMAGMGAMGLGMMGGMGIPMMGMAGMTMPKHMQKYNPMGSVPPNPALYQVGHGTAINQYRGVKLLAEPFEGGAGAVATPWVQSPVQMAAMATAASKDAKGAKDAPAAKAEEKAPAAKADEKAPATEDKK
jgi:hypothetical protein